MVLKIKTANNLELSMLETKTLLESFKNRITKDKNRGNVSRLEIDVAVLVHCNIVNNDYQHDSRVLCTFFSNYRLVNAEAATKRCS